MASPRAVLVGASSAQAAVAFASFGLPAIGPDLAAEFDLGLAALGAVLLAQVLGSGVFLIPAGVLVDRYGSRAALWLGGLLGSAGLAGAAFASSTVVLIALLVVSGIGAAIVPIAGFGALFRAYGPGRRGFALGVRQMSVPLGGTVAAVGLPGLEALGGVRLALLTSAAAVLAFTGFFALVADTGPSPEGRPRVELFRVLRVPGMQRLLVVAFLYVVVLTAAITYTVPAVRAAGFSPFVAGATFLALNVTAGVARVAWGRMADREGGFRRVRTLAEIGVVTAAGALLFLGALHTSVGLMLPAAIVFAFGALGWNAIVYLNAGEKAPPELAAQAISIAATLVFVVGAVLTPPLGALAAGVGWDAFWLACAVLAACGAAVASTLRTPAPVAAAPPA
jgi:MFS family permease